MASGACVIRYAGKRGVVWRVKYADADGRHVMETLGRASDGWTETRAQRELGKRLDRVERERWRKPDALTFEVFAKTFEETYLPSRRLKPSTTSDYKTILDKHLVPFFGKLGLASIEASDVDGYIAAKSPTLSAKTIGNHLALLRLVFKVAVRWRKMSANPVLAVDRPRVDQAEMQVLTETEISRVLAAFRELRDQADDTERPWWETTRALVTFALGTAMRRGELLGLRWGDVELGERRVTVRQAFVRGQMVAPKSRASRRTLELGATAVATLEDVYRVSRFRRDDALVFCHPLLGTPLDPSKLSREYLRPALKRAKIEKPFRPFHDLRHTSLTHEAAAGNPAIYVQMRAGHSQASITERYLHAAQVLFPGAVDRGDARIFGAGPVEEAVESGVPLEFLKDENPA